jgi:hypothetical protein
VEVDSDNVRALFLNPPGSRPAGWNMGDHYFSVERIPDGLRHGSLEFQLLQLLGNGHIEFWTPLSEHFTWGQSEQERQHTPRLHPYAVIEYPTTFLRLYRAIIDVTGMEGEFIIQMHYRNLKGYVLSPGQPESVMYLVRTTMQRPYERQHLESPPLRVQQGFAPDPTAYQFVKTAYSAFGIPDREIPFYQSEEQQFVF